MQYNTIHTILYYTILNYTIQIKSNQIKSIQIENKKKTWNILTFYLTKIKIAYFPFICASFLIPIIQTVSNKDLRIVFTRNFYYDYYIIITYL